jgi:hypothetical protein
MSPTRSPVQNHMNPIHILFSFYFKVNFNSIRQLRPLSPVCSFYSGFHTNIIMYFSSIICVLHARLSHSPSFYHHNIRRVVQIIEFLNLQFSLASWHLLCIRPIYSFSASRFHVLWFSVLLLCETGIFVPMQNIIYNYDSTVWQYAISFW